LLVMAEAPVATRRASPRYWMESILREFSDSWSGWKIVGLVVGSRDIGTARRWREMVRGWATRDKGPSIGSEALWAKKE